MEIRTQAMAAISSIIVLLAIGTVAYVYLEGWTVSQSFYFSVVTLTTVGYGDLYPTTDASRLFTSFYLLAGVAITLAALGIIGTSYLEMRENRILERKLLSEAAMKKNLQYLGRKVKIGKRLIKKPGRGV